MAFKLGMTVDLYAWHMFIAMTLTLMQGHSGSTQENNSALNDLEN